MDHRHLANSKDGILLVTSGKWILEKYDGLETRSVYTLVFALFV